jgi:hypothetical protein
MSSTFFNFLGHVPRPVTLPGANLLTESNLDLLDESGLNLLLESGISAPPPSIPQYQEESGFDMLEENGSILVLESGTGPITPAQAAGMTLVLNDDFTSLATVDMANTKAPGFNWYREQWWGNGTTALNSIAQSGSTITLGGGTGRGRLQSGLASGAGFIGNGWKIGQGLYIEVNFRFNPANTNISGFFGVYLFHAPNIYDLNATGDAKWPGQASGYGHFCEVDIFELAGFEPDNSYNGRHVYQGTIHDFSGTYNGSNWQRNIYNANSLNDAGIPAPNWNLSHSFGVKMLPQVGATPGSIQWFFDQAPLNTTYWLGPIGNPPLPGEGTAFTATQQDQNTPAEATRTFAIAEQWPFLMQLDGNPSLPIIIDWVRVWQVAPSPLVSQGGLQIQSQSGSDMSTQS